MKAFLASVFVLSLGLSVAAQSPAPATASTFDSSSTSSSAAAPARPADLASTLTDAESAITATNADLANLHTEKWSSGWKTGWMKKGSRKQQVEQTAESVKAHAGALPEMVAGVRTAHGSVGSAFKLFNNLTLVCEELDSLAEATQNYGKKEEYTRLAADHADLVRIRGNLSTYVEQRAAVVDPRGNVPAPVAASAVKKDEPAAPKKTVAKRKRPRKTVAVN